MPIAIKRCEHAKIKGSYPTEPTPTVWWQTASFLDTCNLRLVVFDFECFDARCFALIRENQRVWFA